MAPDADSFARFVARDVDPTVKNAALKRLFADPHFNVMDGLDTYIDDYSIPDPLPAGMLAKMVQSVALGLVAPPKPAPADGADAAAPDAVAPDAAAPEPAAPDAAAPDAEAPTAAAEEAPEPDAAAPDAAPLPHPAAPAATDRTPS
jgi:hypothetical protein